MADVTVKTIDLQLRTVKLTKGILKQLPELSYEQMRPLMEATGHENPDCVLGWVHGSVLGVDYETLLIMKVAEGQYGIYKAMHPTRLKYQQIYIV